MQTAGGFQGYRKDVGRTGSAIFPVCGSVILNLHDFPYGTDHALDAYAARIESPRAVSNNPFDTLQFRSVGENHFGENGVFHVEELAPSAQNASRRLSCPSLPTSTSLTC